VCLSKNPERAFQAEKEVIFNGKKRRSGKWDRVTKRKVGKVPI
jgi:hypothetical protein